LTFPQVKTFDLLSATTLKIMLSSLPRTLVKRTCYKGMRNAFQSSRQTRIIVEWDYRQSILWQKTEKRSESWK